MSTILQNLGLKKLDPRAKQEDIPLPSNIQNFLSKHTKKNKSSAKDEKNSKIKLNKKISPERSTSRKYKATDIKQYEKQLEYSRNYSKYIKEADKGIVRDDLFPDNIPKKAEFSIVPLIEKKEKKNIEDGRALFEQLVNKKKDPNEEKKIRLKGKGLLQEKTI